MADSMAAELFDQARRMVADVPAGSWVDFVQGHDGEIVPLVDCSGKLEARNSWSGTTYRDFWPGGDQGKAFRAFVCRVIDRKSLRLVRVIDFPEDSVAGRLIFEGDGFRFGCWLDPECFVASLYAYCEQAAENKCTAAATSDKSNGGPL